MGEKCKINLQLSRKMYCC